MTEQANENNQDAESALPMENSSENASAPTPPGDAADPNPMSQPSRAIRPHGVEYSRKLAAAAAQVALDNKGQDVMVLDVCDQTAEFDLFVLATGSSRRQLHAISEQIDDVLEKTLGDERLGIEGYQDSRWIVLDYGSVVIHLFDEETREYYDLESLWADGKPIPLEELGLKPQG
ncbi:Ribosomal silencing factor RsfS [Novipirellula galeiformis]|uniref:Ribosomal silencing factor RsfS n=1 Tax=Novipirellula galeiformis TaxID=2528004 RepID=A0A5C6CT18_9BACT|nr:ribosome silencing factor [Novipirellula galeiformis]TWU26196.1 Ribosomal silencing factor RsfS [Novipirellula galeiformis]